METSRSAVSGKFSRISKTIENKEIVLLKNPILGPFDLWDRTLTKAVHLFAFRQLNYTEQ
jgi:hypothetical protein